MTGLLTALAFIAGILCERAWRRAGRDMDQARASVSDAEFDAELRELLRKEEHRD